MPDSGAGSHGERIAALEAEVDRLRERDERRLIAAARKAGWFRVRQSAVRTEAMFRRAIEGDAPPPSTLLKLEGRLQAARSRAGKDARANDARRKALLGGFLVAQFRHRPDVLDALRPDIDAHIAGHPSAETATRNRDFMAGFLDLLRDGGKGSPDADTGITREQVRRNRTRRLILLGAWCLDRRSALPRLDALVRDELGGFLDADRHAERKRALLADVLATLTASSAEPSWWGS